MSRLLTCGFELNSNGTGVEIDAVAASGTTTVQSSIARSGTYALHSLPTVSNPANTRHNVYNSNTQGILFCRTYVYVAAVGTAQRELTSMADASSNPKAGIALNTDKTLSLRNFEDSANVGSASVALALNTWYRVEFEIDTTVIASTYVEARLDGVVFASGTINLTSGVARFRVGCAAADTTFSAYYDDLAVNDNAGSFQNSWPGSGKVICLRPNAAGDVNTFATQTGGTAGSSNNFTRVKEVTPDDGSTLNGSNTLNQEDLLNMDNSGIGASDLVNVVHVGGRYRNNTADATTALKFEVEKTASGTISQSAAIVPNSTTFKTNSANSPTNYPLTLHQDPDGANWTQTTLDSMQAGYKLTTGGTNRVDVSTLYAMVDYTPYPANQGSFLGLLM